MKFEQVTSCTWSAPVENKQVKSDGWEKYRIVQRGKHFSLCITMNIGGMLKLNEIDGKIPSLEKAIEIAENFDAEHYDPLNSGIFIAGSILGIGLIVYALLVIF